MENSKLKWLIIVGIWLLILGGGMWGYSHFWKPVQQKAAADAKVKEHDKVIQSTSSQSRFQWTININADAFTGYCVLRSRNFRDECAKRGIQVNIIDDQADYNKRLHNLADGTSQMAVFTIDALIKASASYGDFPATIIWVMDETKGADAIVGSKKVFPNIDSLNDPEVKVICTPDSPSEFITRVVMHHYNLPLLKQDCFKPANGAGEVYNVYKGSDAKVKQVYALWEPYVSKMRANPAYHVLVDSGKFRGYIVDVLTVSRDYAVKNPAVVEEVLKAYATAVFNRRNDMPDLILDDTRLLGEPIAKTDAERAVQSIWFKNTTENFGHMGLATGSNLEHIDEMIANITEVLLATGAIKSDPTSGKYALWYYNEVARKMFSESWYPGFGSEQIRQEKSLSQLSDEEWKKLEPVGTLRVPRLVFSRGTDALTDSSEATMTDLVEKLKSWPQYYLMVRGNCAHDPDPEVQQANLELALSRAKKAMDWLVAHGIDKNRIHVTEGEPNGSTTVAFILGQIPY